MLPHPAVRLLVWGGAAVAVQLLQGPALSFFLTLFVALAAWLSPSRLLRLLRRTRWLLVAVAVLFSFSTPGVLLLPELGVFSPTADGLDLAATHLARLGAVLASLALLLEFTPPAAFVGALYGLFAPAAWMGIDRGRIAVRLMLVMHYAESVPGAGWRDWLEIAAAEGPQCITLTRVPWRWPDVMLLSAALLAMAGLLAA